MNNLKIIILNSSLKLKFYLPYFLLGNVFAALIIYCLLKRIGVYISLKNIYSFIRILKKELKYNKDLTVVHVKTASATEIIVKL